MNREKIYTIKALLTEMYACSRAQKRYSKLGRAFKRAWIEAHWMDATWFARKLFADTRASDFPELPDLSWQPPPNNDVDGYTVCHDARRKAYRIKIWPAVRRRLIQLGVVL